MASVFLSELELNDYIGAAEACIIPLIDNSKKHKINEKDNEILISNKKSNDERSKVGQKSNGTVRIHKLDLNIATPRLNSETEITVPKTTSVKEKAKISLSDCLACSGCVTSAESILVTTHSIDKLKEDRNRSNSRNDTFMILTISAASFVDICRYIASASQENEDQGEVLLQNIWCRLYTFFEQYYGIDLLIDGLVMNDISLLESTNDFLHRYNTSHNTWSTMATTSKLPMLTSSCPGFVCYVEKMSSNTIPYLCTVKSPMSVSGVLFKRVLASDSNDDVDRSSVYHVAVMPCHDKKLEASRKEEEEDDNDIDLVITTSDVLTLLQEAAQSDDPDAVRLFFYSLDPTPLSSNKMLLHPKALESPLIQQSTTLRLDAPYVYSSGGYADHIFRYAAKYLFNHYIPPNTSLPWKSITTNNTPSTTSIIKRRPRRKNKDFMELSLFHDESNNSYSFLTATNPSLSTCVLKFGIAYGFKNIQRVIQMLPLQQSTANQYHYIEVMACPSGCTNGGGQLSSSATSTKENKIKETPSDIRNRVAKNSNLLSIFRSRTLLNNYSWDMRSFRQLIYQRIENKEHLPLTACPTKNLKERTFHMDVDTNNKKDSHCIHSFINEIISSSNTTTISAMEVDDTPVNDNIPNNNSLKDMIPKAATFDTKKQFFHLKFKSVPKLDLANGAITATGISIKDTKW